MPAEACKSKKKPVMWCCAPLVHPNRHFSLLFDTSLFDAGQAAPTGVLQPQQADSQPRRSSGKRSLRLEVPCGKVTAALLMLRACYNTSCLDAFHISSRSYESEIEDLMLLVDVITIADKWQVDSVMEVRAAVHGGVSVRCVSNGT